MFKLKHSHVINIFFLIIFFYLEFTVFSISTLVVEISFSFDFLPQLKQIMIIFSNIYKNVFLNKKIRSIWLKYSLYFEKSIAVEIIIFPSFLVKN